MEIFGVDCQPHYNTRAKMKQLSQLLQRIYLYAFYAGHRTPVNQFISTARDAQAPFWPVKLADLSARGPHS